MRREDIFEKYTGSVYTAGNPGIGSCYGEIVGTFPADLDALFEPLSRCLDAESARRVSEFCVDPGVQARVDVLAEKANQGELTGDERAEYEAFINASDFISILKLKARRQLNLHAR
jgi:hypothetical protein